MKNHNGTSPALTTGVLLDRGRGLLGLVAGDPGAPISAVEYNSSRAGKGALFVAVEGYSSDGHRYIKDAVDRGAAAVVVSMARAADFAPLAEAGVTVLGAENTRAALSRASSEFYGNPTARIPVVGVTGTNGKTSITYMLESIFARHGRTVGVIGTVNYRWKGKTVPAPNTTPESRDLQELIAEMTVDGVDFLVMEVSSHGLKLDRVDDICFDAGLFTNLTRDHMDFHPDFDDYFASKKRLFDLINAGPKTDRVGIVNRDDPYGAKILEGRGAYAYPVYGFGVETDADYRPEPGSVMSTVAGVSYRLEKPEKGLAVSLAVAGGFHVSNSLCALAAAHAMGVPSGVIVEGLSSLASIPGRFDRVGSPAGFHVIVDYAHTGDALEKLLASARELAAGRVITLFGCGGDRDKTKRPVMGRAASALSDYVIVTSDNPRTEDPGDIIRDILPGMEGAPYEVEADREKAIEKAVAAAREGDIVVVAGKGHEDYQITGKTKRHFDDREMVRKYIAARGNR